MATYVNDLRLKEIATGDEAGTWGTSTNTNLQLIGEALGYGTQDCFASDADATTTVADGATDPARAMYFKVTSSATLTATRTLTIAPNTVSRVMLVENATTGSQSIAISQGSGANVTIASGQTKMVYLDGAGATGAVVDALADLELGTITVADLTATTVDINGGTIDGVTIGGSSAGAITGTTITGTSFVSSGDMTFGDDDKAIFGAGSDLQIYHDGSNSFVDDAGTGNLYVRADTDIFLDSTDGTARFAQFTKGGAVKLRFNNSEKLATTATGIDVTGTVTADGFEFDYGDTLSLTSGSTGTDILSTGFVSGQGDYLYISPAGNSSTNNILFRTANASTYGDRLKIANNGDISFYEDTGTTPKFFWDASAEALGIGTTSPDYALHVNAGLTNVTAVFESTDADTWISLIDSNTTNNTTVMLGVETDDMIFRSGGAAYMRLDDSGNLLVGKTAAGVNTDPGFYAAQAGNFGATVDGGTALFINRQTSDGDLIELRKDGSTVGSIGTANGNTYYSFNSTKAITTDGASDIVPCTSGGVKQAGGYMSLGSASFPFNNLFLSNGVQLSNAGAVLSTSSSAKISMYGGATNRGGQIDFHGGLNSNGILVFRTGAGAGEQSEKARIDSSGNLQVGFSTYASLGTVNTGARWSSDGTTNALARGSNGTILSFYSGSGGAGNISVTSNSAAYNTSSDARLKENIADAEDAGAKVDAIQVRQFDWKADGSHQDYGMVAQELMTVAPEAVSGDPESDDMMGVDYSKLVPMMLKEIQSLRARVAQLEGA